MANSILKSTKCNLFCGFANITSYCLDCPALMCSQCKISMHSSSTSKQHIIIDFKNVTLNWADKDLISNIVDDEDLASNVHTEVNRDHDKSSERETDSADNGDVSPRWVCAKCTYDNLATAKKCQICSIHRNVDQNDTDYDNKIELFQKDMLVNFVELDQIHTLRPELPFEHVMFCYTHKRVTKETLRKWYKINYPDRKHLSFVNCIIEEKGYAIRAIDLERQYNALVKENNDTFLTFVSDPTIKNELLNSSEFLEPNDMNKLNNIPKDLFSEVLATEQEVWEVLIKDESYTDCEMRMLMVEMCLNSEAFIYIFGTFLNSPELGGYLKESCPNGNVKLRHIRQAISDEISIDGALNFLQRTCELCCSDFPIPEMRGLITCQHEFCKTCILSWLKETIASQYPHQWKCAFCTDEESRNLDKNLYYGQLRGILVEDQLILDMFEAKLLEEQLRKSPYFHWCSNEECTNGFEAEGINKIQCPSCRSYTCANCGRMWKEDHEGKTCQEYELWMLKNDNNLSNLLRDIGIECPGCGMRYALSAGGCLHFNCKVCPTKFCGGCYQFMFDNKCNKPNCTLSSLHAHHPRNCLYFLRDDTSINLESMLKIADYPRLQGKPDKNCPLKVTDEHSFKEHPCNVAVHATTGLCEPHYKEYLVQFINRYKVDPADFATSDSLNLMFFQMALPQLEKAKNENDAQFKERLLKEVKEKCLFYIPKGVDEIQPVGQ